MKKVYPKTASTGNRVGRFLLSAAVLFTFAILNTGCDGGDGTGGNAGSGGATGGSGGSTQSGGGGGAGGGGVSACFDYSGFSGAAPAVGFKADVLPILQRSCGITTGCHGDPNHSDPKRPYWGPKKSVVATPDDIAIIRSTTVGVPSYYEPQMNIITPGDPEHSFVLHKLDHTLTCDLLECAKAHDCGTTMPQGNNAPLAADERDLFRRWIAQGALDN